MNSTPELLADPPLPAWLPRRVRGALAGRPLVARLLGNVSWLLAERLALLATGFLVNIWFVRYLGPERFGIYAYALSFAALFGAVTALGMDSVIVRELARHPESEPAILGTALRIRVVAGLVAWALAIAVVIPLRSDRTARVLVAVVSSNALLVALGVFEFWFHAHIAARGMAIARTGVAVGAHLVRLFLIAVGAPLLAFGTLYVLSAATTVAALYVLYRRARPSVRALPFDRRWAAALLRDSWPMILVTVSAAVYMKVDQVMLVRMSGERENGIYAVAVALSELWYFIPVAISASVFPVVVRSRDTLPPHEFEERMQILYDAMAVLGYAVAVPVVAFAGPLVRTLYGPAYAPAAEVLEIHVVSFLFVGTGLARGRFLVAENLMAFMAVTAIAAAALNVALNLLLIPAHGAVGAAWSTLISYAAANYASGFLSAPVRRQAWLMTRALLVPLRPWQLVRAVTRPRPRPAATAAGNPAP